jgi:hypothetical protein
VTTPFLVSLAVASSSGLRVKAQTVFAASKEEAVGNVVMAFLSGRGTESIAIADVSVMPISEGLALMASAPGGAA